MMKPGKAALWVVLASATTTVMAGSIISPVLNVMGEGLNVDPSAARLIITTHGVLIAVCSPFIGALVDRFGVRKLFIFGLVLYGLAGGSGLLINTYWLIIASRVLLGIGVATVFTCNTVLVLNLFEGERRNKVMGWRSTGNAIGGVSWPLLGGALGTLSWHFPFGVYLIGIPLALLALAVIPEVHKRADRPAEAGGERESVFRLIGTVPIVLMIYALVFVANIFLYSQILFLPKLLETFDVTSPFLIGLFVALLSLSGGAVSLQYARIKRHISYRAVVLVVMALWACAFFLLAHAFAVWVIILTVALFGVGMGLVLPTVPLWIGELVPLNFRGRMSSYIATFSFVGQFLSSIMLSPVAAAWGTEAVYLVVSITSAVLFVAFLFIMRRRGGAKGAAQDA
jgi:MFS transporter, ACDE family, multidrug resistance protein